ncbi:MAG: transcriptional regulator, partial [Pseudomonadales bacterium]
SMAFEEELDQDLVRLDASHLFKHSTTNIGFRRGTLLRGFMYDFIESFSPNLTRERVDAAMATNNAQELAELFANEDLPLR